MSLSVLVDVADKFINRKLNIKTMLAITLVIVSYFIYFIGDKVYIYTNNLNNSIETLTIDNLNKARLIDDLKSKMSRDLAKYEKSLAFQSDFQNEINKMNKELALIDFKYKSELNYTTTCLQGEENEISIDAIESIFDNTYYDRLRLYPETSIGRANEFRAGEFSFDLINGVGTSF